jgi:hypothetical protein
MPPRIAEGVARPGYVYVARAASGRYKIGGTGKLARRIRMLRYSEGQAVELVCAGYAEDVLDAERRLQRSIYERREQVRQRPEWFTFSADELAWVVSQVQQMPASKHAKYAWFLEHRAKKRHAHGGSDG